VISVLRQLAWYARRAARMSAPEIAFRGREQIKRLKDARTHWGWDGFGQFKEPVSGLPGMRVADARTLRSELESEIVRLRERRFCLLNQEWPPAATWDAVWHLDPVTRAQWPGRGTFAFDATYRHVEGLGDVKFVWEANRLQFLPILALAGEWDVASEVLHSWMTQNPPFDGINWTSGIEAATRIVSLLGMLAFADADICRQLDRPIRAFLETHAFWIDRYPSLYSSANNHRIAELVGLFLAGVCAPGLADAAQWREQSRLELEQRITRLFLPDGVGAEQSTTYAPYALEWFALAGIAGDASGHAFSSAYKALAGKAAEHLRWLMDDDARTPQIGDGDETRVLAFRQEPEDRYPASVSALVARWLDKPELIPDARHTHFRDMLGPTANESSSSEIPSGMRVFEDGGYTVIREATGRGTILAVLDHGPLGFLSIAAHGHADALSVWLHWGDEVIFVDAGTYLYHSGGAWRDHFRSTAIHNTLAIDDANQSMIAGPFNWARHAHSRVVAKLANSLTAEHTGYIKRFGVLHRRTMSYAKRSLVVEDYLLDQSRSKPVSWKLGFMVAPGIEAKIYGDHVALTTPKGRSLRLVQEFRQASGWGVERVSYSPSFNRKLDASRIFLAGTSTTRPELISQTRIEFDM
jgi:hypothetical protein